MFLSAAALAVVIACMLAELALSRRNERLLVARGAVQPPDPVYNIMRWAYPGTFVAMAAEGAIVGRELDALALIGVTVLAAAKLLKFWAIATLGTRWTYRVLVIPGAPRITSGPYRWMRHPNYAGVVGELLGMALMMAARLTGPISLLFFSWLLYRRIRAEERALGMRGIY
jgi:methyltransferase